MCSHWVIDMDVRLVRFTDVVLYVITLQMFNRFSDSSDSRFIRISEYSEAQNRVFQEIHQISEHGSCILRREQNHPDTKPDHLTQSQTKPDTEPEQNIVLRIMTRSHFQELTARRYRTYSQVCLRLFRSYFNRLEQDSDVA